MNRKVSRTMIQQVETILLIRPVNVLRRLPLPYVAAGILIAIQLVESL